VKGLLARQLARLQQFAIRLARGGLVGFGFGETFGDVLLGGGFVFLDFVVLGLGQVLADGLAVLVLHLLAFTGVAHVALSLGIGGLLGRVIFRDPLFIERRQRRGALEAKTQTDQRQHQANTNLLHRKSPRVKKATNLQQDCPLQVAAVLRVVTAAQPALGGNR